MTWQPLTHVPNVTNTATGQPVPIPDGTWVWQNDLYLVQQRMMPAEDPEKRGPAWHLSIRNQDRSARHDWRDFQRIKNQLCGDEYWAYEVYPAESQKVDTANQYHLFAIPFDLGFSFSDKRVVANHGVTSVAEPGAVQRDNEPIDGPVIDDPDFLRRWAQDPQNNEQEA